MGALTERLLRAEEGVLIRQPCSTPCSLCDAAHPAAVAAPCHAQTNAQHHHRAPYPSLYPCKVVAFPDSHKCLCSHLDFKEHLYPGVKPTHVSPLPSARSLHTSNAGLTRIRACAFQAAFKPKPFVPEPSKPPRAADNLKYVAGKDVLPYEDLKRALARCHRACLHATGARRQRECWLLSLQVMFGVHKHIAANVEPPHVTDSCRQFARHAFHAQLGPLMSIEGRPCV